MWNIDNTWNGLMVGEVKGHIKLHKLYFTKTYNKILLWEFTGQRPILDLIWNLPTLNVRHVPKLGILILYSLRGDAGHNSCTYMPLLDGIKQQRVG